MGLFKMIDALTSERATNGRAHRAMLRWLLIPVIALALAWSYGLFLLVRTKGVLVQHIRDFEAHPVDEHNLASFRYGPTISASSFQNDFGQQYHPLFLVDGVANPLRMEKWGSHAHDKHPWVEIVWHTPMTLNQVVVTHSGAFKEDPAPLRKFTIRCIQSRDGSNAKRSDTSPFAMVSNNTKLTTTHALHCQYALGIRLEAEPNDDKSVVRLYEVEAWGQ